MYSRPFAVEERRGYSSAFGQRGEFARSAVAHEDRARETFLGAKRTTDAMLGIELRYAFAVQRDGQVRTTRAVAAVFAEFAHHFGQFLRRR